MVLGLLSTESKIHLTKDFPSYRKVLPYQNLYFFLLPYFLLLPCFSFFHEKNFFPVDSPSIRSLSSPFGVEGILRKSKKKKSRKLTPYSLLPYCLFLSAQFHGRKHCCKVALPLFPVIQCIFKHLLFLSFALSRSFGFPCQSRVS